MIIRKKSAKKKVEILKEAIKFSLRRQRGGSWAHYKVPKCGEEGTKPCPMCADQRLRLALKVTK